MQEHRDIVVPINEKYMLTIKEAAAYFNIGIKRMRRFVESNDGEFAFIMGNKYLICRPRFEQCLDGVLGESKSQNLLHFSALLNILYVTELPEVHWTLGTRLRLVLSFFTLRRDFLMMALPISEGFYN